MVNYIGTFGLNVHMHECFDCDDAHLESGNLAKDSSPIVGWISIPSGPSTFESIVMCSPSDLDEETKTTWEVLKAQLILNKKTWVPHHKFFLP
jgi:hypothetical protein